MDYTVEMTASNDLYVMLNLYRRGIAMPTDVAKAEYNQDTILVMYGECSCKPNDVSPCPVCMAAHRLATNQYPYSITILGDQQ